MFRLFISLCAAGALVVQPARATAQDIAPTGATLSRLVAEALERSPRLRAARSTAEAVRAGVSQAGAWEDPTLTLGFTNLRTTSFDFSDDFMTMKIVQLAQRIPLPGQIGHRREASVLLATAADAGTAATRVEVVSAVKQAYAELYFRDRALEIVERNLALLRGLEDVTQSRYATGAGSQPAVLRAGLEIEGLEAQRIQLVTSRLATLAQLNALRDRPAQTPVGETEYPPALLAVAESGSEPLAFASALGIGTRDPRLTSPQDLPSLDSLVAVALDQKPALRAHIARIGAQTESLELARAMRWPAPQLSVGYGQREGFADMLNATLSFRLPIFTSAKQGAAVREQEAVLATEQAMHHRMVADIERDVTAAYAGLLDALGQIERYDRGILRRSEATLDATLAAYRSGSEDFLALLDSQARLYGFELERHRRIADLLVAWAELEAAVGQEIRP